MKWPEMRSKVNFGHPKWPTAAILSKFSKKKSCVSVLNGQKCHWKWILDIKNEDRRTFCKKSKVNFGHPKWATAAIMSKISKKHKVAYWSEMARNAIKSEFRTSKIIHKIKIVVLIWNGMKWFLDIQDGTSGHFFKNICKKSCASNLNNVRTDCWPTTIWYQFTFGQYIYRQVCWERGDIHGVRPLGRIHTILVVIGFSNH